MFDSDQAKETPTMSKLNTAPVTSKLNMPSPKTFLLTEKEKPTTYLLTPPPPPPPHLILFLKKK